MKFADINKKFSEAVAKTLAKGFQICCNTMGGSQGEIAHVNFVNAAGEHFSLILDKEPPAGRYTDGMNLLDCFVIRWVQSKEIKGDLGGDYDVTFWRGGDHVEVISEVRYWRVSDSYRSNYFVDSEEEAEAISSARWNHWKNKPCDEYRTSFTMPMSGATRKMVEKVYRSHKARWQKAKIAAVDIEKVDFRRNGNARTITIYHGSEKTEVNF